MLIVWCSLECIVYIKLFFFVLTSPFLLTGTLIPYANLYLSTDPLFAAQF